MTSDAKIGLLLGLIFIFVIAFVINGLPSLRPPNSKGELQTVASTEDWDPGNPTTKAQEVAGSLTEEPSRPSAEAAPAAADEPKPVAKDQTPPTPTGDSPENAPRFATALPVIQKILKDNIPVQKEEVSTSTPSLTPPTPAPVVASEPPVATAPQPILEPRPAATEPKPADTEVTIPEVQTVKPVTTLSKTKPVVDLTGATSYTTVAGDNLAVIAVKAYGREEGNRRANVDLIARANVDVLPNPDKVRQGIKLTIPKPLPKATPAPSGAAATPADVLPPADFVPVKAPGDKSNETLLTKKVETWAAKRTAAAATAEGSSYTVKPGDSLWKIAASQLGSGTRCDDIAKLNADVLKGKDALMPGMTLRLPPK